MLEQKSKTVRNFSTTRKRFKVMYLRGIELTFCLHWTRRGFGILKLIGTTRLTTDLTFSRVIAVMLYNYSVLLNYFAARNTRISTRDDLKILKYFGLKDYVQFSFCDCIFKFLNFVETAVSHTRNDVVVTSLSLELSASGTMNGHWTWRRAHCPNIKFVGVVFLPQDDQKKSVLRNDWWFLPCGALPASK